MPSVGFACRAATAMFLHGASPRTSAELRAPPFKAAARYWLRAALADLPLDHLRKIEAETFGDTKRRGVSVSVGEWKRDQGSADTLPHKNGGQRGPSPRIPPKTEFNIDLAAAPWVGDGALPRAAAAMWIALHLGGVGLRSRRGAGSVVVTKIEPAQSGPLVQATDVQELATNLSAGLASALTTIRNGTGTQQGQQPAWPSLLGASIVVAPVQNAHDESAARRQIMLALRAFKDPAFGLPYSNGNQNIRGRHASPLWIRLVPLNGTFAAVYTFLRSRSIQGDVQRISAFLESRGGFPVRPA